MLEVNVKITGFKAIDYDKKKVRKALRVEGTQVRNIARVLVSRRGRSKPGENPGRQTGLLRRSIALRTLPGQLAVVIEPTRTVLEKQRSYEDAAYPWILNAGVKGRVGRRADYVQTALGRRTVAATEALYGALEASLVARK